MANNLFENVTRTDNDTIIYDLGSNKSDFLKTVPIGVKYGIVAVTSMAAGIVVDSLLPDGVLGLFKKKDEKIIEVKNFRECSEDEK